MTIFLRPACYNEVDKPSERRESEMIASRERVAFVQEDARGKEAGAVTAYIKGEIDQHSAKDIRCSLDEYISRNRPSVLRLDASAVTFMDSAGLGLLMGRLSLMKQYGGELILVRPGSSVMRMIRLAGMERLLRIEK